MRRRSCRSVLPAATVFGGAALSLALKENTGRARPMLPDPVSAAPGSSFPSGHVFAATIGGSILLRLGTLVVETQRLPRTRAPTHRDIDDPTGLSYRRLDLVFVGVRPCITKLPAGEG